MPSYSLLAWVTCGSFRLFVLLMLLMAIDNDVGRNKPRGPLAGVPVLTGRRHGNRDPSSEKITCRTVRWKGGSRVGCGALANVCSGRGLTTDGQTMSGSKHNASKGPQQSQPSHGDTNEQLRSVPAATCAPVELSLCEGVSYIIYQKADTLSIFTFAFDLRRRLSKTRWLALGSGSGNTADRDGLFALVRRLASTTWLPLQSLFPTLRKRRIGSRVNAERRLFLRRHHHHTLYVPLATTVTPPPRVLQPYPYGAWKPVVHLRGHLPLDPFQIHKNVPKNYYERTHQHSLCCSSCGNSESSNRLFI